MVDMSMIMTASTDDSTAKFKYASRGSQSEAAQQFNKCNPLVNNFCSILFTDG